MAAAEEQDASFPRPAYAWYVFGVIFLANMFAFIDRIVVAILTPAIQADLKLSDSQVGLLQGLAFALFYTLFGVPLGWLVDRWNRKRLLAVGMTVWSLMTALCGAARGFPLLLLARLGVGMGEGSVNPCAGSLIGDYFAPRTRPLAFGFYVSSTAVGQGLTFLFGGVLLGWLVGHGGLDAGPLGHLKPWQAMFVIVGLAGLLPVVLFVLTVREPKRRETVLKGAKATPAQARAFIAENWRTLICHHLGIALATSSAYTFASWLPTFFLRKHGWEPARFSQTYGFYVMITAMVASVLAGSIGTWLKRRGMIDGTWRVFLLGSMGVVICGPIAPFMPTPELALAMFVATGFFSTISPAVAAAAIVEFVPNEMRGLLTASYYVSVGIIASGFGPLFVGLLTDYVFHDPAAIDKSMGLVSLVAAVSGASLLVVGLKTYRAGLARATWLTRT